MKPFENFKEKIQKFKDRKNFVKADDIPIECQNLVLAYRKKEILKGVNFTAENNKVTVLLGKNGSGKTTLLRCISGIRKFSDGKVKIFGVELYDVHREARAKTLAFMPQYLPQLHITVRELIEMGRSPYMGFGSKLSDKDKEKISFAIKSTDVENHLDDVVCTLSGGERQLAFLAMTLATDAEIILLDEPTASLDVEYRHKLYKLICRLKEAGKTLVITMHNLDEAVEIADVIFVIDDGRAVFSGTAKEFVASDIPFKIFSVNPQTFTDENGNAITVFRASDS